MSNVEESSGCYKDKEGSRILENSLGEDKMTLLEKINSIRVKSTTVTFGGISLELGLKESEGIKQVHLQELLKMRNMVSFFYFWKIMLMEKLKENK